MQIHSQGAVRHAEKRRRGTCEFANRIARISLDTYESTVPKSYRDLHKQTCVAAIVAHFDHQECHGMNENLHVQSTSKEDVRDKLQVMGLGVGTKFLPASLLQDDQNNCTRIRDCHAEVLARRAFRRQILYEIENEMNENTKNASSSDYLPILERIKDDNKSTMNEAQRLESATFELANASKDRSLRYRLKPGVTLHFYCSSAPCGNATLKKFVKMEKETFDSTLPSHKWPEQKHTPIAAHSLRLGQFALLVKRDSSLLAPSDNLNETDTDDSATRKRKSSKGCSFSLSQSQSEENEDKRPKAKPWPYRQDDSWCPPSCSIAKYNKGTIHSCSDKLCRWNCLGLQGSLLMTMLEEPLYMTTLTVGRKFSRAICQRAVCCRAEGFSTKDSKSRYRLNHPVLMETNVYMDEAGTHDMEGIKAIGQDASFDSSSSCWVWWQGKMSPSGRTAECIDGKTGLVINHDDPSVKPKVSEISSQSYASTMLQISLNQSLASSGLKEMVLLKRELSPEYEAARNDLLRHRVFREWSCRCTT